MQRYIVLGGDGCVFNEVLRVFMVIDGEEALAISTQARTVLVLKSMTEGAPF